MSGIIGSCVFDDSNFRLSNGFMRRMGAALTPQDVDETGPIWACRHGYAGLGTSPYHSHFATNKAATRFAVWSGDPHADAALRTLAGTANETGLARTFLDLYETAGMDILPQLDGAFACAVWDEDTRTLCIAHDKLGLHPLYYSLHHGRFHVASRLGALLQVPDQRRRMSPDMLFHHLTFSHVPAPFTLFEGIRTLPAGCWAKIHPSSVVDITRYWDPLRAAQTAPDQPLRTSDEIRNTSLHTLEQSLDVVRKTAEPTACLLDTPLPSCLMSALASEGGHHSHMHTLPTAPSTWADDLAAFTQMTPLASSPPAWDTLTKTMTCFETPVAHPHALLLSNPLTQAAQHGATTLLSAHGAQALYGASPRWAHIWHQQNRAWQRVPSFMWALGAKGLALLGRRRHRTYARWHRRGQGLPLFWGTDETFTHEEKMDLFLPRVRPQFDTSSFSAIASTWRRFCALEGPYQTRFNWMTYAALGAPLHGAIAPLWHLCAAHGLRLCLPFLTSAHITSVLHAPDREKISGRPPYPFLQKIAQHVIPQQSHQAVNPAERALHEWYAQLNHPQTLKELDAFCGATGLFDKKAVRAAFRRNAQQAWCLYSLMVWWKTFIKPAEDRQITPSQQAQMGVRRGHPPARSLEAAPDQP